MERKRPASTSASGASKTKMPALEPTPSMENDNREEIRPSSVARMPLQSLSPPSTPSRNISQPSTPSPKKRTAKHKSPGPGSKPIIIITVTDTDTVTDIGTGCNVITEEGSTAEYPFPFTIKDNSTDSAGYYITVVNTNTVVDDRTEYKITVNKGSKTLLARLLSKGILRIGNVKGIPDGSEFVNQVKGFHSTIPWTQYFATSDKVKHQARVTTGRGDCKLKSENSFPWSKKLYQAMGECFMGVYFHMWSKAESEETQVMMPPHCDKWPSPSQTQRHVISLGDSDKVMRITEVKTKLTVDIPCLHTTVISMNRKGSGTDRQKFKHGIYGRGDTLSMVINTKAPVDQEKATFDALCNSLQVDGLNGVTIPTPLSVKVGGLNGMTIPWPSENQVMDEAKLLTILQSQRSSQGGQVAAANKVGIHGRSSEQHSADGTKGGQVAAANKVGIHGRSSEQHSADGTKGGLAGTNCGKNAGMLRLNVSGMKYRIENRTDKKWYQWNISWQRPNNGGKFEKTFCKSPDEKESLIAGLLLFEQLRVMFLFQKDLLAPTKWTISTSDWKFMKGIDEVELKARWKEAKDLAKRVTVNDETKDAIWDKFEEDKAKKNT
jgi:hypothetical protein